MRILKRSDSSFYWIDYVKDGQRVRMSLKTTRKAEAQERADEIRKHQWLVDQGLAIEKAIIYTLSYLATNY